MKPASDPRQLWQESFDEQIARQAYNTAPVEALVRCVSYYLRDRYTTDQQRKLHFLELGCGAGSNLVWLARRGIKISGVDIAANALALAKRNLEDAGCADRIGRLVEASVTDVPLEDGSIDGILEACVFQHLRREERARAFAEVCRLLKPGGLFVGYMLAEAHTIFRQKCAEQLPEDPGTLYLADGKSRIYLSNIGVAHFFRREEYAQALAGFAVVDPCLTTYALPREEAVKRGYAEYVQGMWTVYAIK